MEFDLILWEGTTDRIPFENDPTTFVQQETAINHDTGVVTPPTPNPVPATPKGKRGGGGPVKQAPPWWMRRQAAQVEMERKREEHQASVRRDFRDWMRDNVGDVDGQSDGGAKRTRGDRDDEEGFTTLNS